MIAVAGGKGGCGKTTTTACLARAMADRGARPVVVDGDRAMPDLHVFLGGRLSPGVDALAEGRPLSAVCQSPAEMPGVTLVAAGEPDASALGAGISRLADRPHPVLIDTAAGASRDVAVPLRAADRTVLVSTPTRRSLADAAKTAAMARALDAPPVGAVITASDGAVNPEPLLDCPALAHVPTADDPLADPAARGAYERAARVLNGRNV